jgi:hypothetical protein
MIQVLVNVLLDGCTTIDAYIGSAARADQNLRSFPVHYVNQTYWLDLRSVDSVKMLLAV